MKKNEFIDKLKKALEIDSDKEITENTDLRNLEEYDSLAQLAIIAVVDKAFGKQLSADNLMSITSVEDLVKIIGQDKFD